MTTKVIAMRKVKLYKNIHGSKKQKKKLEIINKFQDDISINYFNSKFKNKN